MRPSRFLMVLFVSLALALITNPWTSAQTFTFTTVHSFNGTDGETPDYVVLTQGRDGWLYGTTYFGGANGLGVVFKKKVGGPGYIVLHNFSGPEGSNVNPRRSLSRHRLL